MKSPLDIILSQPIAHLVCYSLTVAILFVTVWQAWLLKGLKAQLRQESDQLQEGGLSRGLLVLMIHPAAKGLLRLAATAQPIGSEPLLRCLESAEHALFSPLRHSMMLARDVSTLMGLVSTCVGLVTAAAEFVRHGKPELMVGSIGTAAIGTIIAGVGCVISLWNLSRLANLRLGIAQESDELLLEPIEARQKPAITVLPADPVPEPAAEQKTDEKDAHETV